MVFIYQNQFQGTRNDNTLQVSTHLLLLAFSAIGQISHEFYCQ